MSSLFSLCPWPTSPSATPPVSVERSHCCFHPLPERKSLACTVPRGRMAKGISGPPHATTKVVRQRFRKPMVLYERAKYAETILKGLSVIGALHQPIKDRQILADPDSLINQFTSRYSCLLTA